MGTGVLLTADGYFITNAHVVSGASQPHHGPGHRKTYEASGGLLLPARISPF